MESRKIAFKKFQRLPLIRKVYTIEMWLFKAIIWILWDFTGLHLIYRKIVPNKKKPGKKYPSFFLWIVGIYIALYGIASNKYENHVVKVENLINSVIIQLSTPDEEAFRSLISSIPGIQRIMGPSKPSLFVPKYLPFPVPDVVSVINSLTKEEYNEGKVIFLKDLRLP